MTNPIGLPQLAAIARKHGFQPPSAMPVPWTGATGQVFPCGDVVVKVPLDRPDAIHSVTIDARLVPFVRFLGVTAPALVAFDDSLEIAPVPFAVFERVHDTVTLDTVRPGGSSRSEAWMEVGRQLARVHAVREGGAAPMPLRTFRQSPEVDPRPWVEELRGAGAIADADARWLRELLDKLAPDALADLPLALCHGDVNAANVLVDGAPGTFRALIDWGWIDPAWDFAAVSLDVVPALLAGHWSVAPLIADGSAEARILWCQIQIRLHGLREAPADAATRQALGRHIDGIRRFARSAGLG